MSDEIDQEDNAVIRDLRAAADAGRAAEARAAAAERELAFAKAGIPLDDPKIGYFVRGYEGDTTPEAIKAAATEAGFLSAPPAPETHDDDALRRIAEAAYGAETPMVVPADEARDATLREKFAYVKGKDAQIAANEIAEYLMSQGQPVSWEGPQMYSDGSTFKPIAG